MTPRRSLGTLMVVSGGRARKAKEISSMATTETSSETWPPSSSSAFIAARRRFADDFHVFAVEWEPNAIRFYVDDQLYITRTRLDLRPGWKWVFDHPFFLLLNVAVGGDWPG